MIILASSSGTVPVIARLAADDERTVREVIHAFNDQGLSCLDPKWAGGRLRLLTPDELMGIDSRSGECANEWILARSTPYEGPLAEGASRTGTKAGPSHEQKPAASPDLSRLIDLKKVIAWVREHAHQYGANPTPLFVAGSSAGGHMAASAALTQGDPAFQPGFENADTSVREPPARG